MDNDRNTNNRRESHDRSRDSYKSQDRSRDSYKSQDRSRDSYNSQDRSRDSYQSTSHDRSDRDYRDRDYRNYNNPNDRDRNDRGMYSSREENRRSRPVPHQQQRSSDLDRRGGRSSRNITDHRSSRGDDRNR